jgi:hypothetical protein
VLVVPAVGIERVVSVHEAHEVPVVAQGDARPSARLVRRRRASVHHADAVDVGDEPDELARLVLAALGYASTPGPLDASRDLAPNGAVAVVGDDVADAPTAVEHDLLAREVEERAVVRLTLCDPLM